MALMPPHSDKRRAMAARFGENLRAAREYKDISQAALAALMCERGFDWHQSTVNRTEHGERAPGWDEAVELAELLGTTTDRFGWLQGEAAAVAVTDAATVRIRRAFREASDAALRLEDALEAGRRQLEQAKESRYRRVREAAPDLEAEIEASTVEAAVDDALARLEDGDR